MSDPELLDDINVRSTSFGVACTVASCNRCHSATRVVALWLPGGHETLDETGSWAAETFPALIFQLAVLPDTARIPMQSLCPCYQFGLDATGQARYWANHCEACGERLDDHDLYCEPEGAFLPITQGAAATIYVDWVDAPLEAAAGGFSLDPLGQFGAIER